ncbi:hypothetical protein ACIRU3_43675 [Streptomyces sp. NPDC101151]|uniref:hypothetical protein n=1 Tax=Streptomyces sp. NPDC101151 TaxID=3366115 RepID=UPI00382E6260
MKITSRILAVAAACGALLAATATARAANGADVLNLVNAKRVPVSVLSEGNIGADNIQITDVGQTSSDGNGDGYDAPGLPGLGYLSEALFHPDTSDDSKDNGFVSETPGRNSN